MKHRLFTRSPRRPVVPRVATLLRPWFACTVLTCASAVAFAQSGTQPAGANTAANPAADTAAGTEAASAVQAPSTPPAQAGKLTLDQQVHWLRQAQQSGEMEKLDDAQLTALFQSLDPLTLPRYIKEGPNSCPSYEFIDVALGAHTRPSEAGQARSHAGAHRARPVADPHQMAA